MKDKSAESDKSLVFLGEARRAIERAKGIPELKEIRDKAEAVRRYCKAAQMNQDIQNHAAELKLRAERRAGDMLKGMVKRGGDRKSKYHDDTLKLDALGLTKLQASRWQREATVPEREFERFLKEPGGTGEITTAGLLRLAAAHKKKTRLSSADNGEDAEGLVRDLAQVYGQCRCIYLDPPWAYRDESCSGSAKAQYPTMTEEEICALPVAMLFHPDGVHVWMWTTWPMIRDGVPHRVLDAWGVRWVGELVWLKPGLGVGRWLRPSTEILALAVCKNNFPLRADNQRGHIEAKREGHSRKPDVFYETIETLSTGPRIELFARRPRAGWWRWGNEA